MRRRHDLIGTHVGESLEARIERARGLLKELVAPAWRIEPPILVHPRHMTAVCAVAGCPREVTDAGLCNGHALRWTRQGRPNLAKFIATTRFLVVDNHALAACKVPTCRRGGVRPAHLCPTHRQEWLAAKQPPIETWSASADVRDPGITAAMCRLPHCELLAENADPYCRVHARRWHNDGCRAHAEFEAVVMNYGDPRWDFRRLPAQLKLELQYGLQRCSELGYSKSAHSVGYLTRMLLRSGATTLLDRSRAEWQALFRQQWPNPKHGATSYVFLGFVVQQLADLLDGATNWPLLTANSGRPGGDRSTHPWWTCLSADCTTTDLRREVRHAADGELVIMHAGDRRSAYLAVPRLRPGWRLLQGRRCFGLSARTVPRGQLRAG